MLDANKRAVEDFWYAGRRYLSDVWRSVVFLQIRRRRRLRKRTNKGTLSRLCICLRNASTTPRKPSLRLPAAVLRLILWDFGIERSLPSDKVIFCVTCTHTQVLRWSRIRIWRIIAQTSRYSIVIQGYRLDEGQVADIGRRHASKSTLAERSVRLLKLWQYLGIVLWYVRV